MLIYVLLAAGAVTAVLQHWVDAGVILGVVVINAVIGFVQEGKAERALEAVRGLLSLQATVIRGGRRRTLPAEELVTGDLVFLQSGDRVPADLRLVGVRELRVDEAILTGESVPAGKETGTVRADAPVGDRRNMAYSGTLVTYGQGTGVIVATGDATEIGRISAMLAAVEPMSTPLTRQMARFARLLTGAILVIAGATAVFGIGFHGYPVSEMFLAAVGLAVAAIPEGLPAIITITLAIGVQRMAARNAIVRRLPAVETLGSVTVHGVGVDALGEIGADRAGVGLLRIGRAHQFAVLRDGVFTLEHLHDHRAGGHERHQILEERAFLVLGVEAFGVRLGQLDHLRSDNSQIGLLEAADDLADDILGNGVGLDDGQSAFNSHKTLQTVIRQDRRLQRIVNLRIIRRLTTNA